MRVKEAIALAIAVAIPIAAAVFVLSPAAIRGAVDLFKDAQGWPTLLLVCLGLPASIWVAIKARRKAR